MCTLHFWSPLKCSSILHFQSLQRKNPNVSFLIRWNVYKKRTFWKLISYIFLKNNCLCTGFFCFCFCFYFPKDTSSSLRNSSYNIFPKVRGHRTHSCSHKPPTPWQDSFLTPLPPPPPNRAPRTSQSCFCSPLLPSQRPHWQKAWGWGITWGPGVWCPQHRLLVKLPSTGLCVKGAANHAASV